MDHYSSLRKLIEDDIDCHFFDSIESTSSYLTKVPYSKRTQLCVTREQTMGKVNMEETGHPKKMAVFSSHFANVLMLIQI